MTSCGGSFLVMVSQLVSSTIACSSLSTLRTCPTMPADLLAQRRSWPVRGSQAKWSTPRPRNLHRPSHLVVGVSPLWPRTVLLSLESNNRKIAGARRYVLSDCGALHRGGTVPQCATGCAGVPLPPVKPHRDEFSLRRQAPNEGNYLCPKGLSCTPSGGSRSGSTSTPTA